MSFKQHSIYSLRGEEMAHVYMSRSSWLPTAQHPDKSAMEFWGASVRGAQMRGYCPVTIVATSVLPVYDMS